MIRAAFLAFTLLSVPAYASEDEALGHALTLLQTIVHIGTQPGAEQGLADVLAGRNSEANRALSGLFEGASADLPPEYRDRMSAIGKDLASFVATHPVAGAAETLSTQRSLQARKDLNQIGLRYYDDRQFLEAVRRNDALAVELFIAGRGVNLASRDERGRNAVEIARANGNAPLAELLARNLPPAR